MFEFLGELFSGGALGGIVGTAGSTITRWQERKTLKVQNEHEHRMTQLDIQMQRDEMKMNIEIMRGKFQLAELEGEISKELAATKAFDTSLKAGLLQTGIRWVDAINSLMRPLLTTMCLIIYFVVMLQLWDSAEAIDAKTVNDLLQEVVFEMSFISSSAILWWFGSRPTMNR